jgi:hypothetical protein
MSLYNVKLKRVEYALTQFRIQEQCTQDILGIMVSRYIKENPIKKNWFWKDQVVNKENFWEMHSEFGDVNAILMNVFPKHYHMLKNLKFRCSACVDIPQIERLNLCVKANDFVLLSEYDMKFVTFWESYLQPFTKRNYFALNIKEL